MHDSMSLPLPLPLSVMPDSIQGVFTGLAGLSLCSKTLDLEQFTVSKRRRRPWRLRTCCSYYPGSRAKSMPDTFIWEQRDAEPCGCSFCMSQISRLLGQDPIYTIPCNAGLSQLDSEVSRAEEHLLAGFPTIHPAIRLVYFAHHIKVVRFFHSAIKTCQCSDPRAYPHHRAGTSIAEPQLSLEEPDDNPKSLVSSTQTSQLSTS